MQTFSHRMEVEIVNHATRKREKAWFEVTLTVDDESIIRVCGWRAAQNKSGVCKFMDGRIVAKARRVRPIDPGNGLGL